MIRSYRPEDAQALAELCHAAILETGRRAYSAEQVQVWAMFTDDVVAFRERLKFGTTLIAEIDGAIAALAQLHPLDHIDLLYTSPRYQGRGLASALIAQLEAVAQANHVAEIITEASHLARPVFERAGFQVVERELVERGGLIFERFKMAKQLAAKSSDDR
jgi:putative acetyltransferase